MSLSQPTVSVIMPAHNVDRCVRRAVESLQNQTLRDFELLAVDDGSTDRTGDILDKMAERDIRITVFHNENDGVLAARDYALDRARGTYVYFMNAGDWIEPRMLEDMVSLADRSMLDLVVTGFYIDTYYGDAGEYASEVKTRPDCIYPTQQEFRAAAWQLFDQNLFNTPWNKLYVREWIERLGIRFDPTLMDDFPFVLDYIRDVERVGMIEQPYYHFICKHSQNETVRWRRNLYRKHEDEHGRMLDLYHYWGLDGDSTCMEMIQRRYIERLIGCIENVCNPACTLSAKEKIAQIDEMITSDRAQLAVATAHPRSRMLKAMLLPIKAKNARLAYREGKVISYAKRHNTKVFAAFEANR